MGSTLAVEPPFRLGALEIDPARLEVAWAEGSASLQPRAMQVLVRLARTPGAVVSRDVLVADCWDGRAVSDDALNRIIHLLRTLARRTGGRGFDLKTVAKVGYRLEAVTGHRARDALLAVLAFDNQTGDPSLDYFSDGLSEEILYTVGKTTSLRVIGRGSSFSLRGAEKTPARAAALLGATHALDGAVRRDGERVRVTAELTACDGRSALWAARFDHSLADIFAVQDEIAAAVAEALHAAFKPRPFRPTIDAQAYDFYLRARDPTRNWPVADIHLLEIAVERSPGFAEAWALLAYSRAAAIRWAFGKGVFADLRQGVETAARTALSLDPTTGQAWLALATIEPICGRFAQARALVRRALDAAPGDPVVLAHAGGAYDVVGRLADAAELIARAYESDPGAFCWYHAYILEALGRTGEAQAAYDRDLARWPGVVVLAANALRSAMERANWSRYDRLLEAFAPGVRDHPLVLLVRATAERARRWNAAEAKGAVAELRAQLEDSGTVSLASAALLAHLGLEDEAHDALAAASFAHLFAPDGQLGPPDFGLNVLFSPLAVALRRDPRFVRLCVRLGLGAFWAETGEWPDCAAEVAPWYDLEAEVRAALADAA